jgi:hypothetical protein
VKATSLVDPTTHQVLHVNQNIGKLQIDSVSQNAAVGHVISGHAAVRVMVVASP